MATVGACGASAPTIRHDKLATLHARIPVGCVGRATIKVRRLTDLGAVHADRATSLDGIHFADDPHNPVLGTEPPHSIGDVSSFVYDYHTSSYLATIKMFFAVNTSANYTSPRRSVGISMTRDPTAWPQPIRALTADDIDDRWAVSAGAQAQQNRTELYGLSSFAYQSQYVGLLWVAHFNAETDGTIEVELVSSRDGKRWRRADAQADGARPKLIPRGPAAWDGMMVHTSTHPLLINDTLHLYYQGDSCSHHHGQCLKAKTGAAPAVGLATLRRDGEVPSRYSGLLLYLWCATVTRVATSLCILCAGFVSLSHGSNTPTGVVLTQTVSFDADAGIRINYSTEAGGVLRVALIDPATGKPHLGRSADECVPLHGDSTDALVTWTTGSEIERGPRTIDAQIQFHMDGPVEVYSYAVR